MLLLRVPIICIYTRIRFHHQRYRNPFAWGCSCYFLQLNTSLRGSNKPSTTLNPQTPNPKPPNPEPLNPKALSPKLPKPQRDGREGLGATQNSKPKPNTKLQHYGWWFKSWGSFFQGSIRVALRGSFKGSIGFYLKDPKLWELWYIPCCGSCRIYIINCMSRNSKEEHDQFFRPLLPYVKGYGIPQTPIKPDKTLWDPMNSVKQAYRTR